jgi:hypothetical protein
MPIIIKSWYHFTNIINTINVGLSVIFISLGS